MSDQDKVVENNDLVNEDNISNEPQVDTKAYERTKNHMHEYKRKFQESNAKLEELANKLTTLETERLEKSENYKELWEKEREQKESYVEKYNKFTKSVIEDKKMNAIREHAIKTGINDELIDLLGSFDTSDVLVETTSNGNFIVNGADTWIADLKNQRPSMFKRQSDPVVNNKTGNFDGQEKSYSPKEVVALQKSDPKLYNELITKKRHLIKRS